jgi:uncharacterized Zn finger protein
MPRPGGVQKALSSTIARRLSARAQTIAGTPELFVALLNEQNLRRLAGPRSYERGVNYAITGRVIRLLRLRRSVEASVLGTSRYRVELWVEDGELTGSCSCPMGDRGLFCKHCVAVGLITLNKAKQPSPGQNP